MRWSVRWDDKKLIFERDDGKSCESISQYIIRTTFSLEKLTNKRETGTVIYRSKMAHGENKKSFQVYNAGDFITAITQHIPEKPFQMLRYFGQTSHVVFGINEVYDLVRYLYFRRSHYKQICRYTNR